MNRLILLALTAGLLSPIAAKAEQIPGISDLNIYKGKGRLESFHAFQCIRSYFYDLSMDDLEGIAGQYGINI